MSLVPLAAFGRRLVLATLVAGLAGGAFFGSLATPAMASTVCTGDVCIVYPDAIQTPLGLVTVSATDSNVVTVHLAATTRTVVFGVSFAVPPGPPCRLGGSVEVPPGPPCLPGYTRTTIETSGGAVIIDTFQLPPGPPSRIALPSLAIISIHPPGPCKVSTSGSTVVFTPIS